ncbi:MAG: alpha/beta hydrolase [Candidatus Jordarchaeales archaeon]
MKVKPFSVSSGGIPLRGAIYLPGEGAKEVAVCFCHGLPREARPVEEKGYSTLAEEFASKGFVSVIFNFQGTVGSGGYFSLSSWSKNLRDVISYISSLGETSLNKFFVVAFSMGAIAAASVAATDGRVSGFACCSCPYDTERFAQMLREGVRLAGSAGIIRLGDKWLENLERDLRELNPKLFIHKVSPKPLLVVHGEEDEIFPVEEAYKLFEAARPPKDMLIVKGVGHHVRGNREAVKGILSWVERNI